MSTTRSAFRPAPAIRPAGPDAGLPAARRGRWADAALVVLAHGSVRCAAACAAPLRHAAALRRRGLFAAVEAGFVMGTPDMHDAIARAAADTVYIVPCFLADGYYVRTAIPRALGLTGPVTLRDAPGRRGAARRLNYCAPVGTSPRLADAIERRVAGVCRERGLVPAATTVLLAGHGTPRDAASSATVRRLAASLAAGRRFAEVAVAFLEEPPFLAEALAGTGGGPVVAVGLLAAEGEHGERDVPRLIATCGNGREIHYAGAIGAAPGVAAAVVERVMAFDGLNA